jgi:carbamoyltransferase
MNYYLGVSYGYHDSAAAIINNEGIIAAAQEERFSRKRHDSSFPKNAIEYCLQEAGINISDVSSIEYYEKSRLKFSRILSSFCSAGPYAINDFSDVMRRWLFNGRLNAPRTLKKRLDTNFNASPNIQIRSHPHHLSHAASAFYPSPFKSAAVLCLDGVGEWHTTSIWQGKNSKLDLVNSISYPHSLGLLYSAFTHYCGFMVDSGEYKLMGLAPYGEPKHTKTIRDNIIDLKDDGSFSLNMEYFEFLKGKKMTGAGFENLFGLPRRIPEDDVRQEHCDIAASIQEVTNDAVYGLAKYAKEATGETNLCLAGGVALNCVANGKLSESGLFPNIWVQPAAGDAGCALGAALAGYVEDNANLPPGFIKKNKRNKSSDFMLGAYLGPQFTDEEITDTLNHYDAVYELKDDEDFLDCVADHITDGRVVGWFQGRMEFGPRALGNRSILGDPRNTKMQETMNLKIKYRESFRPFAPSILSEDASTFFELNDDSPYMLMVAPLKERYRRLKTPNRTLGCINEVRSTIPAITHVDFSARIQTVNAEDNPRYHDLLRRFKAKTGCPIIVNTSFNVRGEPIVCSPDQAYTCFMRTEMDVLAIGNFILKKSNQPPFDDKGNWREEIPLD